MLGSHGMLCMSARCYSSCNAADQLANRATIVNMSPEFGSTCAMFPIDGETIDYLRLTGRDEKQLALVEAYAKEQGMWLDPEGPEPVFSEYHELDLADVVPSIAGPKRPQDRIELADAKSAFRKDIHNYVHNGSGNDDVRDMVAEGGATPPVPHGAKLAFAEEGAVVADASAGSQGRPSLPVAVESNG